jgi:hypothetical protein
MYNFFKDEIIEIEELDDFHDTVDIAVSKDNLFLANGILTHNSSYQKDNPGMDGIAESIGVAATADVILSIFQSEEDQEMSLIKLGMMKNRYGPRGMVQAMMIDYLTLSILQANEGEELMGEEDLNILERLEREN